MTRLGPGARPALRGQGSWALLLRGLRLAGLAVALGSAAACGRPSGYGDSVSCDERRSDVARLVEDAVAPSASTACDDDLECQLVSTAARCSFTCTRVAVSSAGADALAVALSTADPLCGTGCDDGPTPCPFGPAYVGCVDGVCAGSSVPPPTWLSFSMEDAQNPFGLSGTSPRCPVGGSCTLWTLTPDAELDISESGALRGATLSAADFETVDGILRSLDFRQKIGPLAWSCEAAPAGDTVVSIAVTYSTAIVGAEVTDCVEGGPPDNDLRRIFDVFSAY